MFQSKCVYRSPYIYAFLKNNLVDTMQNPSRKKIIKVDTMSNSLLREINSFRREDIIPLWLVSIKYQVMMVALTL
jgi:hypothetical protein